MVWTFFFFSVPLVRNQMTTRSKSKMIKKCKFDTADDIDIDIGEPSESNEIGEEQPKSRRRIGW